MNLWNKFLLLLLFFIGIFSLFGQFARISTPIGLVSIYEIMMSLFVLFTALIHRQIFIKYQWKKQSGMIALFSWLFMTIFFMSSTVMFSSLAYIARILLYVLFALACGAFLKQNPSSSKSITLGLLVWFISMSTLGLLQFLIIPDTRIFFFLGWDDHLSRAFGTLFDPGYFGLISVAGLLYVLREIYIRKWYSPILLALFMTSIGLSYSRSSYVALVAGILTFTWLKKNKRLLLILPLFIVTLFLLPKDGGGVGQDLLRTQTVVMRQEVAQKSLESRSWQSIVTGTGWYSQKTGTGELRSNSAGVDNVFLHLYLSGGLIGLALALTAGWQVWSASSSTFWKAFFVSVLIHSCFSLALYYPWAMLILAITFFLHEQPTAHQK